jgi:tryptophan synthase alpha chain
VTPELMHGMVAGGADVIEPRRAIFTVAPTAWWIQKPARRHSRQACAPGTEMVRQFRSTNSATPIVLMGYANPVEAYDTDTARGQLIRHAVDAGVDGTLIARPP